MKQCDHLAIASSSLSISASESDPEDLFWRDFNFDFSFLISDDHKSGLDDGIDSKTVPKESELYGLAVVDSNVTMVVERSPPSASVLGGTTTTPVARNDGKEACASNESTFSPLFARMSALRIKEYSDGSVPSDRDDTEVDSPCWKGAPSRNTKSLSFRRSRDDVSIFYGLNPMAPQFIPSDVKMNLDKNGKEFEGNGSLSLKRSLSSTFPPSSGEFSINNLYEAGMEQGSDADESLGLVCQDSVSKTMGILDISNQFQRPKKLDPLAPVFVPSYAVVRDKSGVANERNVHLTYASSEVGHIGRNPYSDNVYQSGKIYSSHPRLGSHLQISENTKLDSFSNKTHILKKKLNPLASQFSLADTKPNVYGCVENQAANYLPTNVNSPVLFSPVGYRNHKELHAELRQPLVHVEPSCKEVETKQMGCHTPNILNGNSSPQIDVKKLLTTIHGLSELLTHAHGSETSGSPNEQDLDLINCTVQNLNSFINNGVQEEPIGDYGLTSLPNMGKQSNREHQIPKARNLSASVDYRRKEKYSMDSGETGAMPQFGYVVFKENGFGQVVRNRQTEEQINPHVLFYKSLWLKARADRSLMEYETFISNSRT